MRISNSIVMSNEIQHNNLLLNIKSFAFSFTIHATFLVILFYIAAHHTIPLTKGEERVVISLSDFSSTDGDIHKLEQLPQPKLTTPAPKPHAKTPQPIEPTPISATTPERIATKQPTLSSEASAPLAVPQHPSAPPSTDVHDSPHSAPTTSEKEVPKNSVLENQIGGAALGHIRAMIENAIAYPAIARKLRLEGVVLVMFVLRPDGTVETAQIKSSSGSNLLDTKAIQTILSLSGDYPALGKTFELSIPIAFNLHKS
ncbi:MAG: energy transducer TonB [Sulfuricurvum sp.]|uniref:energy transducer TonB n=1 Tax=Sulfuricurvum sp. TaxID=2025608 RepID=UPI0026303CF5|nr:energy transducer TonB [Sulfuricurvum sp.]MDD2830232.1 energy transducer TonB [Sulfuricurvum sp.]MDD4948810.1 energy transducer TonB [Sulfuricurvum sp.]